VFERLAEIVRREVDRVFESVRHVIIKNVVELNISLGPSPGLERKHPQVEVLFDA
jgi:hypothetical protein